MNTNNYNFKGIIDTTLRDGQQSPLLFDTYKYRFNLEDKKIIIEGLIKLGITYIEFFSPVVSEEEKKDFIEVKKYIKLITSKQIIKIAHCRCNEKDIKEALNLGFEGLNLYMAINDLAQKYSYGKNFQQIKNLIKKVIISTRKKHPNIYLRFSVEDTFRTPMKDVFKIYNLIYPYVDTLGMPDTVGMVTPSDVKARVLAFINRYPKTNLECHFHNDRGLALINAITAIDNGAQFIDASIWGLAERSGITSLTSLLFNLYHLDKQLVNNYHLELCYPINVLMGSILKAQVPYDEPVSLTNRTHTAGVHQKAVLNNKKVYEAHNLEKFGVTRNQILLGPLSGWNLIYYYLKEIENYDITFDQAKAITSSFKSKINRISKKFKPQQLLNEIMKSYPLPKRLVPRTYKVKRIENLN